MAVKEMEQKIHHKIKSEIQNEMNDQIRTVACETQNITENESAVWQWTTEEFLQQAAGPNPTPGGGSISAYGGAMAASMICMVANLTIGKEKYQDVEPQIKRILTRTMLVMENLKKGLTNDMVEFNHFMAALKLPKATDEERAARAKMMQAALRSATEVPLDIARNCLKVIELAREIAPIGNKGAISDVGVAAYLAEGALKSALLNADVNLPGVKDVDYQLKIRAEREALIMAGAAVCTETIGIIQGRI